MGYIFLFIRACTYIKVHIIQRLRLSCVYFAETFIPGDSSSFVLQVRSAELYNDSLTGLITVPLESLYHCREIVIYSSRIVRL